MENNITLCQPDGNKSCCACCGLFNFRDISRDHLSSFLDRGMERKNNPAEPDYSEWLDREYQLKVRDFTSHICPYIGYITTAKPGCLLHAGLNTRDMRDMSLFGSAICNDYLCPAHKILNTEHKEILIEQIDDWYLYSTAVIDPESYVWILNCLLEKSGVPSKAVLKKGLNTGLMAHAGFLQSLEIPLFHYSVSEYDLNKHIFSLGSDSGEMSAHRERIRKLLV